MSQEDGVPGCFSLFRRRATSQEDGVPGCFSLFRRRATKASHSSNDVSVPVSQIAAPTVDNWPKSSDKSLPPGGGCAMCDFSIGINPKQVDPESLPPYDSHINEVSMGFSEAEASTIEGKIDELNDDLRALSLDIHDHPELMFHENYAHDALTKFMESHGFDVTRHYLGLDTAWLATLKVGTGGRTLGFNAEMDALPGIGHACGHNLIAIGGVAAAIGVAAALKEHGIPGTVSLLGTPAEEGGAGKVLLLNKGAYKDFSACLMIHPGVGDAHTTGVGSSLAIERAEAEFYGHTAHASARPWEGRNALDAAFVAYSAISALRQQIKPTHRVHGVVEGKNWAANIIPDYAKLSYFLRAPTYVEVEALEPRIKACFEAAAHATNCELKYGTATTMYDLFQNGALATHYGLICEKRYKQTVNRGEFAFGGSTDFGNITYALPGLHPSFTIPTVPNGGNHTPEFTASARTKEAHAATIVAAKGIALTGYRVLADDGFAAEVKRDFDAGKQ